MDSASTLCTWPVTLMHVSIYIVLTCMYHNFTGVNVKDDIQKNVMKTYMHRLAFKELTNSLFF